MVSITSETHPTLVDVVNSTDKSGTLVDVVELLNQQNEMITDMTVFPSNDTMSHEVSIRTGLPSGIWRDYNMGVPLSKTTTAKVTEEIGNYEEFSEVDIALAERNGNSAAWRLKQERAYLESMNQAMQKQLFFGSRPKDGTASFTGLSPRYPTVSVTTSDTADNVIDGGGTGSDNASIWLIIWSDMTVYGLYPKNSTAGWKVEDMGPQVLQDVPVGDGRTGRMRVLQTHFQWQLGMCVEDWRYAARICNIDKSALTVTAGAALPNFMFEAVERIPAMGMGKAVFYMSRDIRTRLFQKLGEGVKSSTLTVEQVGGVRTPMFQGIPVRRVDALSTNEARIT